MCLAVSAAQRSSPCLRLASRSASLGSALRLRTLCSFQRSPLKTSLWSASSASERCLSAGCCVKGLFLPAVNAQLLQHLEHTPWGP